VGVGATRAWAITGFASDDLGAADVAVHGTDLWEGKVLLFTAVVALIAIVGIRLASSAGARRGLALLMTAIGVLAVVVTVATGARATARLGGVEGIDRMATSISTELGLPEDVVRDQLQQELERNLRVDLEPGLWLTATGGGLLAAGGVASLIWARRGSTALPTS
jgi:hypothetical protein